MASPQFKVSPKAGACALGPRTHGCRVIAGGGACGEQETQKTHAPGPVLVRVLPVLTAAAACTFLYGWPRGPGVSVLAAWLNVRREMSGARSDSPGGRSPAWTLGSRDGALSRGRPGAGPPAGRAAIAPARLRPEVTLGSAHLGGPGLGWGGPRLWLPRGLGGPATKHQLSGFVSCPRPALGSSRPCLISIKTGVVI